MMRLVLQVSRDECKLKQKLESHQNKKFEKQNSLRFLSSTFHLVLDRVERSISEGCCRSYSGIVWRIYNASTKEQSLYFQQSRSSEFVNKYMKSDSVNVACV